LPWLLPLNIINIVINNTTDNKMTDTSPNVSAKFIQPLLQNLEYGAEQIEKPL